MPIIEFLCRAGEVLVGFNTYAVVFRILLSAFIGGCIGFERGQHGRAAGLRTHILVCVGSTMTVLAGFYTAIGLGFSNDPLRASAQVISGIGFLGAGTIMTRNETQITGLTTAAGLWTTASIGITIGMGFYWATAVAFLVVMVTITVLTKLESTPKNRTGKAYYLEVSDITQVNKICDAMSGRIRSVRIVSAKSGMANHVGLICLFPAGDADADLLREVRGMESIVIAVRT